MDLFKNQNVELNSPAGNAFIVSPDDDNDLAFSTRFIYVGTVGDIQLETVNGDIVVLTSLLAGTILPIRAKKIFADQTTVTVIVGLY